MATRTVDGCFFSLVVPDGLLMIRLARSCRHLTIPLDRLWVVRIIGEVLVGVRGFSTRHNSRPHDHTKKRIGQTT